MIFKYDALTEVFQGMYPTVVLILVALQRSHLENQFTYAETTTHASVSVPFPSREEQDWSAGSTGASARSKGTAFTRHLKYSPSSSESTFETGILQGTVVTVTKEKEVKEV
jgi:hypothetical protein